MAISKDSFIKQLFPDFVTSSPSGGHSKKLALVSVGSKFRVSWGGRGERERSVKGESGEV